MKAKNRLMPVLFILLLVTLTGSGWVVSSAEARAAADVTSPEEFFGFQLGADRKIARWDKIVEYFELLQKESDKIEVVNMGPSTEGHPFLRVIISSADNMENLEHLREVNAKISDPRGLSENEVNRLISALSASQAAPRRLGTR